MPYVIISSLIRVETGPTICGDESSDPELMKVLGAELKSEPGNLVKVFESPDPPRIILDKLELLGYELITASELNQRHIWTLHKPYK